MLFYKMPTYTLNILKWEQDNHFFLKTPAKHKLKPM